MAKKQRRVQQHRGQRPTRRRTFSQASEGQAKYKPGFPMNLLSYHKAFYIIGLVAMGGGLIVAALLAAQNPQAAQDIVDTTPTATVEGTPTATATPDPRRFTAAEQVINTAAYDYRATIRTSKGDIVVDLFQDEAPVTVNNFVFLAQKGFYDGLTFHRVQEGFVAQAGDPTGVPGDNNDGPGYVVQEEPNELRNTAGRISMAKIPGQTTFGSQWFINLKDNPALDFDNAGGDKFYPFAEVVEGMDVVLSLVQGDTIEAIEVERELKPGAEEPLEWDAPEQVIDAEKNSYRATIKTEKGDIVVDLFADIAPNTVNNFVFLAQQGFYDEIPVQRVEPDFVVQAGDPTGVQNDGYDGPGYTVEGEPNELKNTEGRIAMAKVSGASDFGSQWFINLAENSRLDYDSGRDDPFYPFGEVVEGMDVVRALEVGDTILTIEITETPK